MVLRILTNDNVLDIKVKDTFDIKTFREAIDSGDVMEINTIENTNMFIFPFNIIAIELIKQSPPIEK